VDNVTKIACVLPSEFTKDGRQFPLEEVRRAIMSTHFAPDINLCHQESPFDTKLGYVKNWLIKGRKIYATLVMPRVAYDFLAFTECLAVSFEFLPPAGKSTPTNDIGNDNIRMNVSTDIVTALSVVDHPAFDGAKILDDEADKDEIAGLEDAETIPAYERATQRDRELRYAYEEVCSVEEAAQKVKNAFRGVPGGMTFMDMIRR
jgi:hypothetical protein